MAVSMRWSKCGMKGTWGIRMNAKPHFAKFWLQTLRASVAYGFADKQTPIGPLRVRLSGGLELNTDYLTIMI